MHHLPFNTIVFIYEEFLKKLDKFSIKEYEINIMEKVLCVEDSLILYIKISKSDNNYTLNPEEKEKILKKNNITNSVNKYKGFFKIEIFELTYNEINFKHNHSEFIRNIKHKTKINEIVHDVYYKKFESFKPSYMSNTDISLNEKINEKIPELKLEDRYNCWLGVKYYFIIFEIISINTEKSYAISIVSKSPESFVTKICTSWIKKGIKTSDFITHCGKIKESFNSWKGKKRQFILENCLKYSIIEFNIKDKSLLYEKSKEIINKGLIGLLDDNEWNTYKRPSNRWKTEESVYKIIKNIYKNYNVIYQHRPFF